MAGLQTVLSKFVLQCRARLCEFCVRKDDRVEAHQGIVVMEAMKMQNEIRSPKAGRVVQLNVREGDAVKLGDLIAQVE